MAEQTTFETRLADAFDRYVAPAPVEVDAHALAHSVAASAAGQRWRAGGLVPTGRRLVLIAAALLVAALAAAVVGSRFVEPPKPPQLRGELLPAGSMQVPRTGAAVTTLLDGRVLVVGGSAGEGGQYRSGEIWDPSTNAFTATPYGTSGFAALTLADGRALVVGSRAGTYQVYDPATGRSEIRCCAMGEFTTDPALALLADGRILLVGGTADRSARLFDPASHTSTPTGPMIEGRVAPQAITLRDGRVLVLGGGPLTAELYEPATGTFTPTGSPGLTDPRLAVLLGDGRVLVSGSARFERTAPAVVYDPTTGRFDAAAPVPNHVTGSVPIGRGQALLIGDPESPAAGRGTWAVVYDPEAGVIQELPAPTAYHPSVAALPDGRVLLVGGYDIDSGAALDIAEVYR